MAKRLEIITSGEDIKEREELQIEYSLYKAGYLEVIKIFLNNCKQIEESNNRDEIPEYQKYPHNMDNVITIVGGRGSGKTTAMQEICNIFLNFNAKKKEWIKKLGSPYASELEKQTDKEFAFSVMEVIDASVLEEKDDLLEIILWYMCREVSNKIRRDRYDNQNMDHEGKRQKFIDALEEVYRMHQSVKGKNEEKYSGESVVTALENMPNSIRTRQAMRKLLDIYCEILFPRRHQNAYLVVAIDDLDLNIQKGYQMLEEIRRYLLDWQIIVLLAVDYKQMENICETYFYREFGVRRYNIVDENLERHISELSNSYMTKVFPFSNRIYLAEQILKRAKIKDGNRDYSIKGFLLYKIARKMHIFYDAIGLKIHFCEPNNVRELVSYVQFLDALNTIEWKLPEGEEKQTYYKKQLMYYDQNHEKFNQDIVERMAFQILRSKQRETFNELLKRDLERRVGYVIQCYENSISEKEDLKVIMEKEHYTFGEFLGIIYDWGRKNYEYKPLVHCLIASFTSEMTREYYNYRYGQDVPADHELSRERSKKRLEGYLGEGIGGGWLCEGLGRVYWVPKLRNIASEPERERMLKPEKEIVKGYPLWVAYDGEKDLENMKFHFSIGTIDAIDAEDKCIQILSRFCEKKILPILECIFMCIGNWKSSLKGSKCIPGITIKNVDIGKVHDRSIEYDFEVKVKIAKCADFDILGFIKKSVDYQTWIKEMGNEIQSQLIEYAKVKAGYNEMQNNRGKNKNKYLEEAIKKLKKTSMFENEKSEYEMALPLYNLDLSYNILKRVRRRCVEEFSKVSYIGYAVDRIDSIYKYIEEELENDAKRYKEIDDRSDFIYTEIFHNDPYIKKFRELINDSESKKNFLVQLNNMYMTPKLIEPMEKIYKSLENE